MLHSKHHVSHEVLSSGPNGLERTLAWILVDLSLKSSVVNNFGGCSNVVQTLLRVRRQKRTSCGHSARWQAPQEYHHAGVSLGLQTGFSVQISTFSSSSRHFSSDVSPPSTRLLPRGTRPSSWLMPAQQQIHKHGSLVSSEKVKAAGVRE